MTENKKANFDQEGSPKTPGKKNQDLLEDAKNNAEQKTNL